MIPGVIKLKELIYRYLFESFELFDHLFYQTYRKGGLVVHPQAPNDIK